MTASAFKCPVCGTESFHPEDGRRGWCGRCKEYTGVPVAVGQDFRADGLSDPAAAWAEHDARFRGAAPGPARLTVDVSCSACGLVFSESTKAVLTEPWSKWARMMADEHMRQQHAATEASR